MESREIDYSKDVNDILIQVSDVYKSLYGIIIDINERMEKAKKLTDYMVTLDNNKFGKK